MMPARWLTARDLDFGAVRSEFALVADFPPAALAEAAAAVDAHADGRADRTDIPFVTIDPPTSMDLDQAVHIERTGAGFTVHYAIADVAAMVLPGGALDTETRRRGQTFYLPDESVPLHPRELSEGSASLLPGQVRPAALWTIELDDRAEPLRWSVTRARVKSVQRFDYVGVQADADAGTLHPSIAALPEFGRLRIAAAVARGAVELRLPEQEVVRGDAGWRLEMRPRTAADDWNAQVSLLTGMCAARTMLDARIGFLRTLPPAEPEAVQAVRRSAAALGVEWPESASLGEFLAGLDPNLPASLALMSDATGVLRGADYAWFAGELPEVQSHSAIGGPYAHVTAPLRRLGDRFATEICLAASAGTEVPQWVRDAGPQLRDILRESDARANKVERACVDLAEATVLADRVGDRFDATVLRAREEKRDAEVLVTDPPVIARCSGDPAEGTHTKVTLKAADPIKRRVQFTV